MNSTVESQTETQIEANSNMMRSRAERKGIYETKNTYNYIGHALIGDAPRMYPSEHILGLG